MLNRLHSRALLAALLCFLLHCQRATATHVVGGQLTYQHLTGDQYRVQCKLYADIASPARLGDVRQLECQASGCADADGRNFSVPLLAVGPAQVDGPFPLGGSSYATVTYEATVTLPPALWTLKVKEENRSAIDNLVDPIQHSLYLESTLNTLLAAGNTSPQFHDLPIPQLPWQRHVTYGLGGREVDGDSVTYQLVTPLFDPSQAPVTGCPRLMAYAGYAAGQIGDPATGQTFDYPAGQYAATFPLVSLLPTYPGGGAAPTVVPEFGFDQASGAVNAFLAPVRSGTSRYAVAVRADEYRLLGGSYQRIGSVMREVIFIVTDPGSNRLPQLTEVRVNAETAPRTPAATVLVAAGQSVTLTFAATDPDADQTLTYYADLAALPGAALTTTATGATFQWQSTAQTRPGFYRFPVTVVDNNLPLHGFETRIITLRVVNTVLANKTRQPVRGAAYPVPFTDQVTLQLPTAGRQHLTVLDALGRPVAALVSQPDGTVVWRPAATVAPGTYFVRTANGTVAKLLREAY